MRRYAITAIAATAVAGLGVLAPATADAGTAVTFQLNSGSLAITEPTAATLTGSGLSVTGTSVSGSLGTTTVSDTRGAALHTDTVTMTSSAFTDGSGHSISDSNVTGYSGIATPTGIAVPVPTATGQALSGAGSTILTLTSVLGAGGATYNPTVTVDIPAGTVAGTYTGTITQTVS